MTVREYSLGHIVLVGINEEFDDHNLPKLISAKRATVETCCPVIRRLQAAYLKHRLVPHVDGLRMQFFLQERDKHLQAFPLQDGIVIPKNGDAFRIEAQAVRQSVDSVRQNIAFVTDPALNFDELTSQSISSFERIALRRLLAKERGGLIDLPSIGENPIFAPIVPRTLPVGTPLLITAEMGEFLSGSVVLENIRRVDANSVEFVDPEIGSSLTMQRDVYGPIAAYNTHLIAAKDLGVRAKLEVVVIREWAEAKPIAFHLMKVHPLFGPYPEDNHHE
jgi:hypothetical protein